MPRVCPLLFVIKTKYEKLIITKTKAVKSLIPMILTSIPKTNVTKSSSISLANSLIQNPAKSGTSVLNVVIFGSRVIKAPQRPQ